MFTLLIRFALRNTLRHRLRTGLTLAGIIVAILAFGLLQTVVSAWYVGVNAASDTRLIARNAISLTFPLPLAYASKIKQIEGVKVVSWANWFGGVYVDMRNFFPNLTVNADNYLSLYPEFVVPPEQLRDFQRDRRGAIAGRKLANRYGWKIGDTIPLKGTIYPGDWAPVLRGIYTGARPNTDENQFFLRWDYVNETARVRYPGRLNEIGVFVLGIDDPRDSAAIARRIDKEFQNSLAETLTETEKAFQLSFVSMTSTIVQAIQLVSYVVILIIMAVMANTMAMAARERTSEYATLKALGFAPWVVAILVYAESLLLAGMGGGVGIWLTGPIAHAVGAHLDQFFPVFSVSMETIEQQLAAALIIGFVAAVIPAYRAMRVRIVDGLRAIV